jgi:hypothetical protein
VFAKVTIVGGTSYLCQSIFAVQLIESFHQIAITFNSSTAFKAHKSHAYTSQYFSSLVSFQKYSCKLNQVFL